MVNALTWAQYIITKCTIDNCPISNLQLQKILYYIQLYSLKETNAPAFNDEIEAWKFGPVVPNVYYRYCGFGSLPIKLTYDKGNIRNCADIDKIITDKRDKAPWDLVQESHAKGKPWSRIFDNGEGNKHIISKEMIKRYG